MDTVFSEYYIDDPEIEMRGMVRDFYEGKSYNLYREREKEEKGFTLSLLVLILYKTVFQVEIG